MDNKILFTGLFLILVTTGCATSTQNEYGNETVISYGDGIDEELVSNVHNALQESGWTENKANITAENNSYYTVGLETGLETSNPGLDEQYRFQSTATMIQATSLQSNQTLELQAYNTQGETIGLFRQ